MQRQASLTKMFCYHHFDKECKVWDEITYPIQTSTMQALNFGNRYLILSDILHYLSMVKWKVIHVSKGRPLDEPLEPLFVEFESKSYNLHSWKRIWNATLLWRHNGHDCVPNHQPHHCLLNCLFGRRSKKTSKLRVTGLCVGNSPGIGEFPAQMASNAENVSIWWRHHASSKVWAI